MRLIHNLSYSKKVDKDEITTVTMKTMLAFEKARKQLTWSLTPFLECRDGGPADVK